MATVNQYRIWCVTEETYVYGWSDTLITVCPNNNTHTIDPDKTTIVSASATEQVQLTGFPDMGNWYYWKKGFRWELTAGETSLKDVKFDEDLRLSGGGYYVSSTSNEGDYIEFQIVDADGLYYPAGTVLSTFISTDYVWDEKNFEVLMDDAVLVYSGLYLRFKYVSTGTENVVVYTWYHMRHVTV